jgi:hypothetical protein
MKKPDKEGKLMLLTVYSVLDDPANDFETIRAGITLPKGLLKDQILWILNAEIKTVSPTEGDTVDKEHKFDKTCHSVFKIASAASAYYGVPATANPGLKAKVNFTLRKLTGVPYNEAQAFMQGIIDVVSPITASLEDYGVVAADVTAANHDLKAFVDVQSKPQMNIAHRKVQNENIHPFVKEGKRILTDMIDPIVNTLFDEKPDLYKLYYNAREILCLPHGTTVVEGTVYKTDGVTPIYNATVKFIEQNITVNTKLDGSYRVVKFPAGTTTPEVKFGGVVKGFEPFEVKLGQTVKRNFKIDV